MRRPTPMTQTSMRPWREISAVAGRMCAFGPPSSKPLPAANRKRGTIMAEASAAISRRSLLSTGLAGGFVLAFHLPVRAFNEPEQPPDETAGKLAPNAFIRIDQSGK